MRRTILVVPALFGALTPAAAQRVIRPGACVTAAQPGETWRDFSFVGLKLALKLPPDLRQLPFGNLKKIARRAHAPLSQVTPSDSIRLVSAWDVPSKSASEIRQVLLYQIRQGFVPSGRPCAMPIAGQPGLVFRLALGAEGKTADEYWIEAYWPGFVLAAVGRSLDAYDAILGLLKSVAVSP